MQLGSINALENMLNTMTCVLRITYYKLYLLTVQIKTKLEINVWLQNGGHVLSGAWPWPGGHSQLEHAKPGRQSRMETKSNPSEDEI